MQVVVRAACRRSQARGRGSTGAPARRGGTPAPPVGPPTLGNPAAGLTIIEYTDFASPHAKPVTELNTKILAAHHDQVRIVFRSFPIVGEQLSAEAAYAAYEQGKFWPMHDAMLTHGPPLDRESLDRLAGEVGLDVGWFGEALDSHRFRTAVAVDLAEGRRREINAVPTLVINSQQIAGAMPFDRPLAAIADELTAPTLGPPTAPVRLTLFCDLAVPLCRKVGAQLATSVARRNGELAVTYKVVVRTGKDSDRLARAALAAHEQGKFWELVGRLDVSEQLPDADAVTRAAEASGLDMTRFAASSADAERHLPVLAANRDAERSSGGEDPPTLVINGRHLQIWWDAFEPFIDEELAAQRSEAVPAAARVLPDPPFLGGASAPVTLTVWTDFTDPECRDVWSTVRALVDRYGDRVRFELKTARGGPISEATLAAHAQGKLIVWLEALAAAVAKGRFVHKVVPAVDDLVQVASDAGLDGAAIGTALADGRFRDQARAEANEPVARDRWFAPVARIDRSELLDFVSFDQFVIWLDEQLAKR